MDFKKLRPIFLFLNGLFGLLCAASYAGEEILVPLSAEEKQLTVIIKDRMVFESDVNRQPGQISVNQNDFEISYDDKAFDILPVVLEFDYKHLDINENLPVNLPAHLEGRKFRLGAKFPIPFVESDVYFMGAEILPSWYTDDSTWTASSFRLPFRTYFIYKPSETFVFVAGVTINVNADTPVTPIIGINWQPNDRWDIHLASSEPTVTYKITDHWSLFAEYDATLDEYEVTRAGQKGVVLKVKEATLGSGIKYSIEKWLEASLSGGASLARRFEYRDGQGKVDPDSAPYLKARLSMKF